MKTEKKMSCTTRPTMMMFSPVVTAERVPDVLMPPPVYSE